MIIHTPRVIASIMKGLWKKRSSSDSNKYVGFLPGNPHVYRARAGIFDVDYLGHMNNASSLTHAEYARWEMTATNGALQAMYRTNTHFMVASSAIRFRRQVRPVFRTFEVQTTLSGIDGRNFWMYQTFRYPEPGNDRIRTQVLIKGVAVKGRQIIEPRHVLADMGVDPNMIEKLIKAGKTSFSTNGGGGGAAGRGDSGDDMITTTTTTATAESTMAAMLTHFEKLDEAFRVSANHDDNNLGIKEDEEAELK